MGPQNVLDDKMDKVFDALLEPVRKRIALVNFEKKYLPFLTVAPIPKEVVSEMLHVMSQRTGSVHTASDLHGNLMNEWIGEIGSPFVEVEVIDAEGRIVYIVPPLLDNERELIEDNADLPQLVEQASNQGRILPELAVKFINNNILPLIRKPITNPKHIAMWNKIYTFHGLPLIESYPDGKPVEAVAAEKQTQNDIEQVDSFDEFGD